MKLFKIVLPLLALACASARAVTTTVDFDGLNAGAIANTDPNVTGFTFNYGTLDQDLDSFGVPIPGTDHWVIDSGSGSATVADTVASFFGPAPTGTIALDASPQTVLLNFSGPVDLNSFQMTLDSTTFGFDGFNAEFYGPSNNLVASVPVLQSTPGYVVSAGPLAGVSYVVIPSGAMYDHFVLDFSPVPEPSAMVLMLGALAPLVRRRRQA